MAIKYTSTKLKKEKPVKVKREKPQKVKQGSSLKIQKDSSVKIKKEKPVKVAKEKKVKSNVQIKSTNVKGNLNISGLKKTSERSSSNGSKKPANRKLIIAIAAIAIVLAVVIIAVLVNTIKDSKEITQIFISSTPNKTVYYVGEKANYEGLSVTVVYKNGKTASIPYYECTITGFDTTASSENQTVTVRYQGYGADFYIIVKDIPKPTPVLVGIHFEQLPKTEYKIGERLDTNGGMLVREYKDGTTKYITLVNSYVYGWIAANEAFEAGVEGPYTLTVKYKENGILVETTYDITITE